MRLGIFLRGGGGNTSVHRDILGGEIYGECVFKEVFGGNASIDLGMI